MPSDELDHAPAALLRYLNDGRRSGGGVQRLLEMGMVSAHELSQLVTQLEREGLVRSTRRFGDLDVQITEEGIDWVCSHYGDNSR